MNSDYRSLEEEPRLKRWCRGCCKLTAVLLVVILLVVVCVQGVMYWWATMKCNAGQLKDYTYPGGGPVNLVDADTLLVEQEPRWWGSSFVVNPADKSGLSRGASTGVYYRTWGPLWNTYTYQDNLGKQTFVIRDRPLTIGGSHKIMRCDGEGPAYVVGEGAHVIMNMIRSIFGMYTSRVYNIWEGSNLVAVSEKLGGGGQSHKQIIFREPDKTEPFASSFLKSRAYHGHFDEWFVSSTNEIDPLPAFVPNAASVLMAFITAAQKNTDGKQAKPSRMEELPLAPPEVLAAMMAPDMAPAADPAAAPEAPRAAEPGGREAQHV